MRVPVSLANSKPRIVIAGQVPPPHGGQNVMIARMLEAFRGDGRFKCEHLSFHFTPDFKEARRGNLSKVFELAAVIIRLLRLRLRGRIDLLIFPAGGPQTVPMVRDILLLPWMLLFTRKVALQFHAAGIADRLGEHPGNLGKILGWLYRRCAVAVVMTKFNRRDPEFFGMERIEVIPHRLPDHFDAALVQNRSEKIRILYVGHLCADKGTPALLRAFRTVTDADPDVILELVGETLPPFSEEQLRERIRECGIEDRVTLSGVLTGRSKQEAFGRADLFAFPSVAPYESFGLVMVEAMMWGLPIIATDWRGNRDVLGTDFEGICHPLGLEHSESIAGALSSGVRILREKKEWEGRNRQLFLDRYAFTPETFDYPERALRWLGE